MIVEREKKMLRQSARTRERVQLEEAARIAAMYTGKGSGAGAAKSKKGTDAEYEGGASSSGGGGGEAETSSSGSAALTAKAKELIERHKQTRTVLATD